MVSKRVLAGRHDAEHGGWKGAAEPMRDDAGFCWIVLTNGRALPNGRSFIQGYRVSNMASRNRDKRIVLIVTVATSMAIGGASLQNFLSTDLPNEINQVVSGSDSTPESQIDQNLAATQLALAAIDTVQSPPGDVESTEAKAHAQLIAGFGAASPAMTAGALLLLYQVAMALFIGLGPLFILCLIFDYTKPLFQKWLLYGIGTMFSLAMLSFISTLMLDIIPATTQSAPAMSR